MKWTLYCLFVECIVSHTANCPDLPSLMNGMIMYSAGLRFVGSGAIYSCNTGYTLTGGATRVCVSEGIWDGSPPTCVGEFYNSCTVWVYTWRVWIHFNNYVGIHEIKFLVDVIAYMLDYITSYTADTGPTEPPCPVLTAPSNGMIIYNMGIRPVDTVATYTCNPGYTITRGTTTRACRSDRVWSGSAPVCQREWNWFSCLLVNVCSLFQELVLIYYH